MPWPIAANGREPQPLDFEAWHALQDWLERAGERRVTIPYAHALAGLADGRAVRLRRDFGAVLNLIRAHAMLHQRSRERDEQGRIVACIADYAATYELVHDIVSEGVQASVKPEIREAVEAVRALDVSNGQTVTYKRVGEFLNLDKSSAMRRCQVALREGYLINKQERKGQPASLSVGEPLPEDAQILPSPERLMSLPSPAATAQPCNRLGCGGRATGDDPQRRTGSRGLAVGILGRGGRDALRLQLLLSWSGCTVVRLRRGVPRELFLRSDKFPAALGLGLAFRRNVCRDSHRKTEENGNGS